MGSFGKRAIALSVVIDGIIALSTSQLLFILSDSVSSRWGVLISLSLILTQYITGIYSSLVNNLGLTKFVTTLALSCVLTVAIVYPLLAGSDSSRILFLLVWAPVLFGSLLLWRSLGKTRINATQVQEIFLLGVPEKLVEELRDALSERNGKVWKLIVHAIEDTESAHFIKTFEAHNIKPMVIYGHHMLDDYESASKILALKIQGVDLISDSEFYSNLTGKIRITGSEKSPHVRFAIEQGNADALGPVIDKFRKVGNLIFGWIMLLVLSVPMLLIALAVKLTSSGPVLFKQERLGKNKRPLNLYKYRTMVIDAEKNGPQWASKGDARVTHLGKVLRELHLDELPQLINICKGELNFVGPRPIRKHFADLLANEIPDYDLRFLVSPGLTGWAQTLGPYGVNTEEHKEKFEYDLYYVTHRQQISDIMIVGLTISKLMLSVFSFVTNNGLLEKFARAKK